MNRPQLVWFLSSALLGQIPLHMFMKNNLTVTLKIFIFSKLLIFLKTFKNFFLLEHVEAHHDMS